MNIYYKERKQVKEENKTLPSLDASLRRLVSSDGLEIGTILMEIYGE